MRQFDIVKSPFGRSAKERPYFVVLQSDLTDETRTVVVAPLAPLSTLARPSRLHPRVTIGKEAYVLASHELAAAPRSAFGKPIGSAGEASERIKTALDLLLYGV